MFTLGDEGDLQLYAVPADQRGGNVHLQDDCCFREGSGPIACPTGR